MWRSGLYIPKANITAESLRHIVENALEKAALQRKVEEQRQELENFADVLVHDLKAPIASIHGMTYFIEAELHNEVIDKDKTIDRCQRIVKAGKCMGAMIDTLREYTKAEAQVEFQSVEMQQVMKDTLSNLEHLIQERGARVTYEALPVVTGNVYQLIQLLQNLIGNGIKYCKAGIPSVHVTASQQEGKMWFLSIKDNGIGIPEQYYKAVFEPFRRLYSASEYEGTGPGLATCKKIIGRHGGTIWCESREGQGTTFLFTLPGA